MLNSWHYRYRKGIGLKFKPAKLFLAGQSPFSIFCVSLVRSDDVPDAGIARYFSVILETVWDIVGMWEICEN